MRALLLVLVAGVIFAGFAGPTVRAEPPTDAIHHRKNKKKTPKVVRRADDEPRVALEAREPAAVLDLGPDPARPAISDSDVVVSKFAHDPDRGAGWQVAVGPYLWVSAVDASVALGGATTVGSGGDFLPLARHAKYGAEILAEVRHGKFVMSGDLMYGAIAINGGGNLGPVMATVTGRASSLLVDGALGYAVVGDEHSLFSLEARGGVRYQRTALAGGIGVDTVSIQLLDTVVSGSDALVGARGFVRPADWFFVASAFDVGVFGASSSTWSASVDASVRITSYTLLSLGYRTLTMNRAPIDLTLHGPRAAVQLVF
jgi:hypothetical protein